jgi:TolA-binding protein
MSDPRRLLDDPNVSPGAKDLVGSLDAPSALATPAKLDIGARVAQSVAAPVAAKVLTAKAVGILAAAVLAGGGTAVLTQGGSVEPAPRAAPIAVAAKVGPAESSPAPAVEPTEPPAPTEAENPKAPQPSARTGARRDTLALEESLLEQARRSIGSPAQALSLLREHERRFPNGELTAERLYLTAQAHARAGNRAAARRYAELLTARFPKSTYVPRVRPFLDN